MKAKTLLCMSGVVLVSTPGCSTRDYTPDASATGAAVFNEACLECHQAEDDHRQPVFFTLDEKNANATYIAYKVHAGSLLMPKFPNIKGRHMRALSEYVLEHSVTQ